jgi:hypothetical protein
MMENGVNAKSLVEEQIFSQMEINTSANIRTVNQTVKAYIHGILEVNMKENSKMDLKMAKVFGGKIKMTSQVINTQVCIFKTRNMVKENLLGNLEIYIKAIIIKMREMAMVKCTLQMALYIKEIGQEACKQAKLQ